MRENPVIKTQNLRMPVVDTFARLDRGIAKLQTGVIQAYILTNIFPL